MWAFAWAWATLESYVCWASRKWPKNCKVKQLKLCRSHVVLWHRANLWDVWGQLVSRKKVRYHWKYMESVDICIMTHTFLSISFRIYIEPIHKQWHPTTEHLGENLFMRSSWPKQPIFQEEGIQHVIVIANYKEVRRDNWSFQIWKGLDVGCLWTLIAGPSKTGSSRKPQEPRCFVACHTCVSEDSGHQVIKSPFKSHKKDFAQVPVWPWRCSFFGLAFFQVEVNDGPFESLPMLRWSCKKPRTLNLFGSWFRSKFENPTGLKGIWWKMEVLANSNIGNTSWSNELCAIC